MRVWLILMVLVLVSGCINFFPQVSDDVLHELAGCEEIESVQGRYHCYVDVAVVHNEPAVCDRLGEPLGGDGCYGDVALALDDLSVCDRIRDGGDKSWCYIDIATARNELSVCDKILDQDMRSRCQWQIAVARNDSRLCDIITYPIRADRGVEYTIDNCYSDVAEASRNQSLCDKIESPSWREHCYTRVNARLG